MTTKIKEYLQRNPRVARSLEIGGFALATLALVYGVRYWDDYADKLNSTYSVTRDGKKVVNGPGYLIRQIEPNSQIVDLNNNSFWWADPERGTTRGLDWLNKSCVNVRLLDRRGLPSDREVSYLLKIDLPEDRVNSCLSGTLSPD